MNGVPLFGDGPKCCSSTDRYAEHIGCLAANSGIWGLSAEEYSRRNALVGRTI